MNKTKILIALKMLGKPKKIYNYLLLKTAYKLRLLHVPALPTTLDIEPNNSCNFKCNHCQVTHWDKKKSQLSINDFKQILNQFPNLLRVKVQGMGEPFLHDQSIVMLEELEKREISAVTTSNGQLLTDELQERLSKLTKSRLFFSIDGGNKEIFEKIRIKGNFEKVTGNIKSLMSKNPNSDVVLWAVITKENIDDYKSIIELTKSLGVKNLVFQTFLTNWGKDEMDEVIDTKNMQKQDIELITKKSLEIAKELDINLEIFKEDYMSRKKPCDWPWQSMFIDSAGYVVPCCVLADSQTLNFGNVFEKSIKEIWNSDQYKEFRRMHRDFEIPDVCKICYRFDT